MNGTIRRRNYFKNMLNIVGVVEKNTLPPYEYEFTCIVCGFNLMKRKRELSKNQRKKNKFYQSIEIC